MTMPKMKIIENQSVPHNFIEFIQGYRNVPFSWGKYDCCLFVADWVQKMCSFDPAAELRGRYHSKLGATRALRRAGFNSIIEIADAAFGERVDVLALARGDIALVKQADALAQGPALGIVWGANVWAMAEQGTVPLPLTMVEFGWRLPCLQS